MKGRASDSTLIWNQLAVPVWLFSSYRKMRLILIPRPLVADVSFMGFPKERSEALPFGRRWDACPVDGIKLIFGLQKAYG